MYIENKYISTNNIEISYRYKPRKYDFNHVIFVFSGFMNRKLAIYDFENALKDCPCDVVWIDDYFYGDFSYYMCFNMDFGIGKAVQEFILFKIEELDIKKTNVTFTGFSKGGSAALYHGLLMDIKNIVCTVPQINIGTYIHENHLRVAKHMMGHSYGNINKIHLDKILVSLLRKDDNTLKNIYLITSESDIQYKTEIEPFLTEFRKYKNFNLFRTNSAFVREHNLVTSHHTTLLLGIYYLLANEIIPQYGEIDFFGSQPISNPIPSGEPCVDLRVVSIVNNRLFIEGIALLKDYNFDEYSDISYSFILKNQIFDKDIIKLPLAKIHKPRLTKDLFDGKYLTIYDKANFTTYKYEGIELSDLPKGLYQLAIEIKLAVGKKAIINLTSKKSLNEFDVDRYSFSSNLSFYYLEIK